MCDAIAHRGPDDAGYALFRQGNPATGEGGYWLQFCDQAFRFINEHLPVLGGAFFQDEIRKTTFSLALGHRRLSIIDLTHYGHQPMGSSDRRYWVSYNGEIYNFPQIRSELEALGHIFRTRSDTEALLHLWEQLGPESLVKLDGMFAFAIYDRLSNELTVARDRFGVKPVYYASCDEFLVFGSEIKAILASGLLPPEIDPEALVEYFTFQNIFSDRTLFKGVRLLPPGHFLKVSPGAIAEVPSPHPYHAGFPTADPAATSDLNLAGTVAECFGQAVQRQLLSDVEVGAYLSGGMDSGSIVAVAGRSIPRLTTFTAGFDLTNVNGIEQGFDERALAEQLSYILQTEHYAVVLHSGDMPAAMERIAWHMDDPRVGMCHQNWYVAKLASKFVKVCLAGAGGDELFGGYPWRYLQSCGSDSFEEFDEKCFRYWHRLLAPEELPKLFSQELRRMAPIAHESYREVVKKAPPYDDRLSLTDNLLQRSLFFEFKTFMHGFLITEDRMSMAHSLETRVPFLDNDLADLAWRIPPSLKVQLHALEAESRAGHVESFHGKLILRQAMESFLPVEYTRQKKQGFSPPDENWYRGPSMEYIKTILLDKRCLERPWFDGGFIKSTLQEHFDGRRNHRLLIWSLLSFEWLQRHFVDGAIREN
jgi:asparagine synthase (glutamine-hydrolysing)